MLPIISVAIAFKLYAATTRNDSTLIKMYWCATSNAQYLISCLQDKYNINKLLTLEDTWIFEDDMYGSFEQIVYIVYRFRQ